MVKQVLKYTPIIKMTMLLLLQIKTPAQVEAAFAFLTVTGSEDLEISKFEEACGVGMLCFGLPISFYVVKI